MDNILQINILLCALLMPYRLDLCVLLMTYRQDYETLFHVVIFSKHHQHTFIYAYMYI
jgi:hypothetical protein